MILSSVAIESCRDPVSRRSKKGLSCVSVVSFVVFILVVPGCLASEGEDTWRHFKNGGVFLSQSPAISPDGGYLVFASVCTGQGDVYVAGNGRGPAVRITTSSDFEAFPLIGNGEIVVFAREHAGQRHLWAADVSGASIERLTNGNVIDHPIVISDDGTKLLIVRAKPSFGMGKKASFFLLSRTENSKSLLTPIGDVAAMSRDGRFVVYHDAGSMWLARTADIVKSACRLTGIVGQPLAVSNDGTLVVTTRVPSGVEWTFNQEIWVTTVVGDGIATERRFPGTGHSPVFLGKNDEFIVFWNEDAGGLVAGTTRSEEVPGRFIKESKNKNLTMPRVCCGGQNLVMAEVPKSGAPDYDIFALSAVDMAFQRIASVTCGDVVFDSFEMLVVDTKE